LLRYVYKIYTEYAIFNYKNFLYKYQGECRENIKEKEMARVLISMPERFLDEIDSVAENENRTRSELIREALRTYMYRNQVRNTQRATKNAEILETLLS